MKPQDFIKLLEQKSAQFRAIVRVRESTHGQESTRALHKWLLSCTDTIGNSRGDQYAVNWLYAEMLKRYNESKKG